VVEIPGRLADPCVPAAAACWPSAGEKLPLPRRGGRGGNLLFGGGVPRLHGARPSQRDSVALDILVKRHGAIERAVPVLSAPHNGAEDFPTLPFDFVEAVPNGVGPRVTHGTMDQDEKIPIGLRSCFTTRTRAVQDNVRLGLNGIDGLLNTFQQLRRVHSAITQSLVCPDCQGDSGLHERMTRVLHISPLSAFRTRKAGGPDRLHVGRERSG